MAEQRPGAALEQAFERGESPGPELFPLGSPDRPPATRELLNRLTDDLTLLVQLPEVRASKRNLNAFVDALKRLDYVRPLEELL